MATLSEGNQVRIECARQADLPHRGLLSWRACWVNGWPAASGSLDQLAPKVSRGLTAERSL
jgi:hypothetical protein